MDDLPEEPANLRLLRRLVTILTATMIGGIVIVIALMILRLNRPATVLPDAITLPSGARPIAFTATPGWYAIVTQDNEILIYDKATGLLHQTIPIDIN